MLWGDDSNKPEVELPEGQAPAWFLQSEERVLPQIPRPLRLRLLGLLHAVLLPLILGFGGGVAVASHAGSDLGFAAVCMVIWVAVLVWVVLNLNRQRRVLRFGTVGAGVVEKAYYGSAYSGLTYSFVDPMGVFQRVEKRRAYVICLPKAGEPLLVFFDAREPNRHVAELCSVWKVHRKRGAPSE